MGDEEAKPPDPPKASPKTRGPALARMGSAYTKAGSKLLLSPQENKAGALLKKRMQARASSALTPNAGENKPSSARSDASRKLTGLQRVNSNFKAIVEGTTEEHDRLVKRREELGSLWYMIHPLGMFRIVWDLAMLCFVCYITLTMPYQLAFDAEPKACSWSWPAKTCEPLAVFERLVDYDTVARLHNVTRILHCRGFTGRDPPFEANDVDVVSIIAVNDPARLAQMH